ncbi:MAG: S41 family peptidase [Anaerolineaceae bacterium]|nr:S41 family peptidase [Anaerolineaceae bacterium]
MQISKKNLYIIGFVSLLCFFSIFLTGFFIGQSTQFNSLDLFSISEDSELDNLFKPFTQAWKIVHAQYLKQPVNDVDLMHGSIRGMMESLGDPYSTYLDPEQYREQNTPLSGEYTGIGAWVDTSGKFLTIISPMPNSPAEDAGLQPGDVVVKIGNQDVTDLDPSLVLRQIIGPADTQVLITISREGESDLLEFKITRAVIQIPSVESELINGHIGYIRLYTFGVNSYDEFSTTVSELLKQGADNLILDLRNNTGGYVDASIDITSIFLKEKVVLIEEWGDQTTNDYMTTKDPITLDTPLYILVNKGTASASEITAGALQDYHRAILIGTTTFGKGLIQNWIPLQDENGAIRVSIAYWLTPNGRQIQGIGLSPDIEIEFTEDDYYAGVDPQLEKAIEVIASN